MPPAVISASNKLTPKDAPVFFYVSVLGSVVGLSAHLEVSDGAGHLLVLVHQPAPNVFLEGATL